MQSLLSFCSICLQLSSLGSQKSEIRLKRDESCTLCITELLQPSNATTLTPNDQFYRETLNKGLYFENPLLQEALKLKLEQQILVESGEKPQKEVQDSSSRMRPQPQPQSQSQPPHQPNVEELFENLVQTVQKLHTPGKEDFTRQRDLADQIIDRKFQLLHILSKKANLNLPNKLSLPDNFPISDTLIEMLKSETKIFLQHEFGFQSSAHPIPHPAFQDFSQKIKELKKRMANTQDSKDLIQEITNLQIQASEEFERVRFSYELDVKEVLNRLYYTLRKALKYAEPIKSGLETGEKLETNGHLTSENGVFNLVMQKDWNLVLYKFSTPIWSTQTFDGWSTETQPELVFDKNSGVLKIQGPNRIVEVNSPHEKYSGNARLTINNNGTVTIMGLNQELWHATGLTLNPASDTLSSRYAFSTSDVLVSKNGIYSLILDQVCELVLYENSAPIWTSGPFPSAVKGQCELKINEQGSLIINSGDQSLVIFPNHPSYRGKTSLLVSDDGTIIIKGGDQELWKTKKESLLNDVNLSSKYD